MMSEGRRTQAVRGPALGGLTPPQSVAASNPCLNCGTNVQLTYCPECGQREVDADPTAREFLHELAQEFLHWDGKLAQTFRTLITKPGVLTEEYLAGRRVRYITPMRLYLTCSVLYFFLAALTPSASVRTPTKRGASTQIGAITIGTTDTTRSLAELDSLARSGGSVAQRWNIQVARAIRDLPRLSRSITAASPNTIFILLPIFAGLFAISFRDRRRRYPQHLAFALHVHAMLFLAFVVLLLARFTSITALKAGLQGAIGACMGIYLLFAAHRVYGGSRAGVLTRLVAVFASYLVAFAIAMVLTAVVIIWRF